MVTSIKKKGTISTAIGLQSKNSEFTILQSFSEYKFSEVETCPAINVQQQPEQKSFLSMHENTSFIHILHSIKVACHLSLIFSFPSFARQRN